MTEILRISVPMTFWLAAFSAVYGLQGFICSRHWFEAEVEGLTVARMALVGAWLLVIAVQVAMLAMLRAERWASPEPTMRFVSVTLAVVALVAAVWSLVPVATTSICY
ncbi:hypothetical protein [Rubellimicrobium sp. CFH 75288]|uniref:hypothetical protein n=1 Tax=Rubellimicrobium sp. CFH 75288 TaxID=2697034 RepID=UPI001412270F|nr:hypothetical protein [Rubellimicrobium sp. CFH 75288]NAZ37017.1 hypothetical protein [Rubellimicrobium sp. CFH 75288]